VSRRVAFFALRGGAGRTTLACEVAALLAVRGRESSGPGPGWGRPRTALLDLDDGLPAASLRLGMSLVVDGPGGRATVPGGGLRRHRSGLLVAPGTTHPWRPVTLETVQAAVAVAEAVGADVTVLDVGCKPGETCSAVMRLCDNIVVVVEPTAAGILDAYRSTDVLRALGLRERLLYVANRCGEEADLGELEADLRVHVLVRIPYDAALTAGVADVGDQLDARGPAAAALSLLATELSRDVLPGRDATGDAWTGWADVPVDRRR
jgi:MinD-like ATPase involved in chromosome partitioning or flagellar assembly